MNKKILGQFYTTNASYILRNLITKLPENAVIVDPFAGQCDLLNCLKQKRNDLCFEAYDIDPKTQSFNMFKMDTLLNPPDYNNKWVVTNPPYLAKNKHDDKTIFNVYKTNDYYKAAIRSITGYKYNNECSGGILIVPLNFLCDEHEEDTRVEFLSDYEITSLNIFEEKVFSDTDYIVCAFSFIRKKNDCQVIRPHFYPVSGDGRNSDSRFVICRDHNYRIGHQVANKFCLRDDMVKVSRLTANNNSGYISNLFLHAMDTGTKNGRIRLEHKEEPYIGKETDRSFATIVLEHQLSACQEKFIIQRFNEYLEKYRNRYHSLFLTNFRNATKEYSRKRISFKCAFNMISYILRYDLGIKKKTIDMFE